MGTWRRRTINAPAGSGAGPRGRSPLPFGHRLSAPPLGHHVDDDGSVVRRLKLAPLTLARLAVDEGGGDAGGERG